MLVLRAFSVLALADLSGFTHTALDVAGVEHADDDCDDEEQGHECPPGCANCHCWHAGLTAPPPASQDSVVLAPSPARAALPPPPYQRTQPRAPDQSALYRPPRTSLV